jgi:hypothetical protein
MAKQALNRLYVFALVDKDVNTRLRRTLQLIASRTFNRSSQIAPSCSEAFLTSGRVDMTVLARWEYVMLWIDPVECLCAFPQAHYYLLDFNIHRNQSLARFRLSRANQGR